MRTDWRPSGVADAVIAVAVFCIATAIGVRAVHEYVGAGGMPEFYQSEFGPAVMAACGRGFHNPVTSAAPRLAAFLARGTDSFACADLPASMVSATLTPFQSTSVYLQLAVALTWKLAGVSWSRLAILSGVLFGSVAALTYGVLRLALWRALALPALVPALMWSPNLMLAPQLRDYAKGPFLLAVIWIMGTMVLGSSDRPRTWMWSSIAGVVIGVGVGFRTDLMIALVPMAFVILLLVPSSVPWSTRAVGVAALSITFVLAALPALWGYARGGNTGHVTLLGLSTEFDRTLRVQPSLYQLVDLYNDTFAFSVINSFAVRVEGQHDGVDLSTAGYDRAAAAYLRRLARTFPADLVTRSLAAMRVVPRYFLDSSLERPAWSDSSMARWLYWLRGGVSARLAPLAVPALVVSILGVATLNMKAGWLGVLVVAAFAGASAIQFHERHFYYLQFLPWIAFGLVAQVVFRAPVLMAALTTRHLRDAAIVGGSVAIAAGGAVLVSRAYQQRAARSLFEQYESAPRTPLQVMAQRAGTGATRLTVPEWNAPLPRDSARVVTRFLAVEFAERCPQPSLDVTFRYEAHQPDADISETTAVAMRPHTGAPGRLFAAVYDRGDESIRFRGLEVAADGKACVAAVYDVGGVDRTPILLNTALAADWEQERLYQRFR